ncbi:MAG: hypothetical protein CBD35_05270 [Verrucomicrobia bacterium TMED175]|nr:MAG: hypothetical protein CBD35_05270 [Verrucomicrobia bacterium TMED175]
MTQDTPQTIATFYKFAEFPEFKEWKNKLGQWGKELNILGTMILAPEGINATISGPQDGVGKFLDHIREDPRFADLNPRIAESTRSTFYRLRIITRTEIVTLGDASINPNKAVGQYVTPEEWNALIRDPDVRVIDTRNEYEVKVGTFKGAENPHTDTFRQWPEYVEKELGSDKKQKIAMFCTGGIRCEKASSHLLENGFEEVYHLKGGILNYLETVPPEESDWDGECFIFDNRVSVTHGLKDGETQLCYGCRWPLSDEDLESEKYEYGISCPRCFDSLNDAKRKSLQERHKQLKLAEKRNVPHIGLKMPGKSSLAE